jgi:hypothetical protein
LSPEEYQIRVQEFLSSDTQFEQAKRDFVDLRTTSIHRENQNINAERSTGEYLTNTNNCRECFELIEAEDCSYSDSMNACHDVSDGLGFGVRSELMHEVVGTGRSQHMLGTFICSDSTNLLYSAACHHSQHCMGSVGLQKQQYCIFNTAYSQEAYEELTKKLSLHMQETGEWGNFFPASISPFGYNETIAQDYFPFERDQALSRHFTWSDYEAPTPSVARIVEAQDLPHSIQEVSDDILNWAVKCERSGKLFRIIQPELEFYRTMGLPLPRRHPDQRHRDRMTLRNPRTLWKRPCAKCGTVMNTTYAPDRQEIVYCEVCYLKEVY